MTVLKCIIDMMEKKNNLRTTEAQIVQKPKNNEARPKFIGSYLKKACNCLIKKKTTTNKPKATW